MAVTDFDVAILGGGMGGYPAAIRVETYEDLYLAARRRYVWEPIGDFAISLDDTEVYRRLEESAHYVINNAWPKSASFPSPARPRR